MIVEVTSFAFLTTVVQSVVDILKVIPYVDSDCTVAAPEVDVTLRACSTIPCDQLTCDEVYAITPFMEDLPNGNECKVIILFSPYPMILVCEDDDTPKPSCEGYDLCVDECFGGSGTCVEPCVTYGLNMNTSGMAFDAAGFANCDAICSASPYGFEYWGQCFTNSDAMRGTNLTCNMANSMNNNCRMTSSSDSDDSNTGVIVGIVIGAVVVVGLIVAVVMYLKKSKQSL